MLYQVSAIGLCSLLLALCAIRRLSLFSPPVVMSLVWLTVFLSGAAYSETFFPITEQAFIAWLLWFSITGFAAFFVSPAGYCKRHSENFRTIPLDYSPILLALLIWLIYRTYELGATGPNHFFLNLRLSAIGLDGYDSLGLAGRAYPLIFALFIFENIYSSTNNKHRRIICWTWMYAYAVATMGKFAVLTPIVTWCAIHGLKGTLSTRTIFSVAGVTLLLMLGIHLTRAGEGDESTLLEVLGTYIYSPIVALGYMEPYSASQTGPYVFRFLYAIGHALNLTGPPAQTILDYVAVPSLTNVYTVLQPFFHDFSISGVFFGAIVYFIIFTALFLCAQRGSRFALGVYAGLFVSFITQPLGETLITNFSGNLQIILCLSVVFFVSREDRHDRRHSDGHLQRIPPSSQPTPVIAATDV